MLNKESKVRMKLSNRKKCEHIWIRSTEVDAKNLFECIRCPGRLTLPAESKEKLQRINELISIRFKAQIDRSLCKFVQNFFYERSNEEYSASYLFEYTKSHFNKRPDVFSLRERSDQDIYDTSTMAKRLQSVINFLVELEFLKVGTSKSSINGTISKTYLHKNQTNWR
jgi:hypothetical protein